MVAIRIFGRDGGAAGHCGASSMMRWWSSGDLMFSTLLRTSSTVTVIIICVCVCGEGGGLQRTVDVFGIGVHLWARVG